LISSTKLLAEIVSDGGADTYGEIADVMAEAEGVAHKLFTGNDAITDDKPVEKIVKHVEPAEPIEKEDPMPKPQGFVAKDAGDRLAARAAALRAHRGNVSMADAIQQVCDKNPELSKAYTREQAMEKAPGAVPVDIGQDAPVPYGSWNPNGSNPREDVGSWDDPSRSQLRHR
jgi:hypothetical protein